MSTGHALEDRCMSRSAVAYVSTLVVFLALDAVWLSLTGASLYKKTLGDIMLPSFNVAPALIFYPLYVVGMLYFAVLPALDEGQWTTALLRGAAFGFFAYATYDFTNQATLRNWTWTITLADLCWGTIVTGVAATAGTLITRAFRL